MSLADELRQRRLVPGPRARRPRRWDLALAWLVLAGPALAILGWAAARQSVGDLAARLAADAHAIVDAPRTRPVHAGAPLPGSLGDALARHLPPFQALAAEEEGDDPARERDRRTLREVVAGDAPPEQLPPRYAVALRALGPDLDGLLAGTRAGRAELEAADGSAPAPDRWSPAYQLAATLAGARVRLALAAGHPDAAVRDCLGALALGRDAAIAQGLVGHMVGAAIVSRLVPPCASALAALPPDRGGEALAALRGIRDAFPPFSATMRDEAVLVQFVGVGAELPPDEQARLGPRCRGAMAEGTADRGFWELLLLRDAWRDTQSGFDDLVRAADLPQPAREAAFAVVEERLGRRMNFAAAMPAKRFARYGARADALVRRLDVLVVAVAVARLNQERGRWPGSVGALRETGQVEEREARAVARLEPGERGGLRVAAPLPRHAEDDRADTEVVLVMPAPAGG